MENEKELNIEEQNKKVDEETPTVFVPDYSETVDAVKPVEAVIENVENKSPEENIFNYSNEVKPVATVEPVNVVTQIETVEPVETEMTEEQKAELREKLSKEEVLENPNAKVVLNRKEVTHEVKQAVEETVTGNESLKFVLILGLILLAAVFVIPYISKLFNL